MKFRNHSEYSIISIFVAISYYRRRFQFHFLPALVIIGIGFSSCRTYREATQFELKSGFYQSDSVKVYVKAGEDSLSIYSSETVAPGQQKVNDLLSIYPIVLKETAEPELLLKRSRMAFDLLTIPVKFRPRVDSVPLQFVAPMNINLFMGYHRDRYKMDYDVDPLGGFRRHDYHVGYSLGMFAGIGNTFISPTYTNFRYSGEYFGLVLSGGLAGTISLHKFTVGLTLGIDHLTDSNGDIWIFQNKPWLGFALGVNLN